MKALQRRGFSLVEILVVIGIVSILFAMSFAGLSDQRRAGEVQSEAERLAGVLRMVRNRAMNEKRAYGVAFNIRNGVGTSGEVLNNWDGGHYYRIFGSAQDGGWSAPPSMWTQLSFPDVVDTIKEIWVSEPYRLPARKVRFLSLSDIDCGPRLYEDARDKTTWDQWTERGYSFDATYPRPWFGIYDQATNAWFPWGGYTQGKPYSAFYYEGDDGPVTGSVHPKDRIFDHHFDHNKAVARHKRDKNNGITIADHDLNGDGDSDDPFEKEKDYVIWRKDEPRDVVNANWLDAALVFSPTGEAIFLEWNMYRRPFYNKQQAIDWTVSGVGFNDTYLCNGINDRCMPYASNPWNLNIFRVSSPATVGSKTNFPESQHFVLHNGGYFLTLAPDATRDGNQFGNVEEVLDSIDPTYRIFIGNTGAIKVIKVQRRRSGNFLDERPTWPENPTDWQDDALVDKNHRAGWLHEEGTVGWTQDAVPMGEPINALITGRMLTERVWWYSDNE